MKRELHISISIGELKTSIVNMIEDLVLGIVSPLGYANLDCLGCIIPVRR